MADKRERVRANMVVYLVCVALSLIIWTIQTLSLPQAVKLRVSFLTSTENPAILATGQSTLRASGFELLPFWFSSLWAPLEVPPASSTFSHAQLSPDQAMQNLKDVLPPNVEILQLTLDSTQSQP